MRDVRVVEASRGPSPLHVLREAQPGRHDPGSDRGGNELGVIHLSGCASYLRSLHGVEEIRSEESEGRRRFGYHSKTIALTVETRGDRAVAANPAA